MAYQGLGPKACSELLALVQEQPDRWTQPWCTIAILALPSRVGARWLRVGLCPTQPTLPKNSCGGVKAGQVGAPNA